MSQNQDHFLKSAIRKCRSKRFVNRQFPFRRRLRKAFSWLVKNRFHFAKAKLIRNGCPCQLLQLLILRYHPKSSRIQCWIARPYPEDIQSSFRARQSINCETNSAQYEIVAAAAAFLCYIWNCSSRYYERRRLESDPLGLVRHLYRRGRSGQDRDGIVWRHFAQETKKT